MPLEPTISTAAADTKDEHEHELTPTSGLTEQTR
jgi:hypothetical protein